MDERDLNEILPNAEGATEEKPSRPVRMRWGRPVEEPKSEAVHTAPAESLSESEADPTEPPKPISDPRLEALRARLEREARAAEEAKIPSSSDADKEDPDASREARPSPGEIRLQKEREAMQRRAMERARAEKMRMERELEAERLRREMQKKRRRDALRELGSGILGLLLGLFRGIRVTKKQVLAVILTLVLALTATVILGNLLLAEIPTGDGEATTLPPETEPETSPFYGGGLSVPDVNAGIVSLEGATASGLRNEARRFSASGTNAVSLLLRNGDGDLLFQSKTDGALGLESETEGLLTIGEIVSPFINEGLYVSCLLPMRYGIDGDEYSESVLYAYDVALLSEVARAGANEVILLDADRFLLSGSEDEEDPERVKAGVYRLCDAANTVRRAVPEVVIGIAFTEEFLESRVSDRYLTETLRAFDLALLDLRSASRSDDEYAAVSGGVEKHLYFILRYSMRVLIPEGCAEAVTREEVHVWQEGTVRPPESTDEG